jgi:adenosylcobinamide-GDP ribazoletransferase
MQGLILAIQFLTRLPTPQLRNIDPANLPRSAHWFPLVGLLIGSLLAAVLWLGSRIDPWLGALLATLFWVWVTGALHLDGLADMSDALGAAHRDRERFLAVLADPHLGTFGAVSLVLQLACKLVLLMLLARSGQYWALLLVPAWARWGALIWACLPALKPGMGQCVGGQVSQPTIWILGTLLVAGSVGNPVLWCAPLLVLAWREFLLRHIGGMTGDLLGAGVEVVESMILLLLVVQAQLNA